jgi:hypothetical protein
MHKNYDHSLNILPKKIGNWLLDFTAEMRQASAAMRH